MVFKARTEDEQSNYSHTHITGHLKTSSVRDKTSYLPVHVSGSVLLVLTFHLLIVNSLAAAEECYF